MIFFEAVGLLSALGFDAVQTLANLAKGWSPGMHMSRDYLIGGRETWVGAVMADLPAIEPRLARHDSRNNRLVLAALMQIAPQVEAAVKRYGSHRVAVVLGTSTSGQDEALKAVQAQHSGRHVQGFTYEQQELGDTSAFVADYLRLKGPCYTISTACSSGARAIISGARLVESGLVDAAIVGGADTLNAMTVNGFDSLKVLSETRCTPFAKGRDGISIGEGAALILLTREPQQVALLGVGESSDAWHMSAPHPQGEGARRAVEQALEHAGLQPNEIGYIQLHGTATSLNDQVEAQVIWAVFGDQVPCSSIKHLTGHTLGAAGCVGAALSYLLLTHKVTLPAQDFTLRPYDDALPEFGLLRKPEALKRRTVLTNAFAFGGNNTCLILGGGYA